PETTEREEVVMPKTLTERLADVRAEAQKIQDAADADGRPKTDEEQSRFDELLAEAKPPRLARDAQNQARTALAYSGDDHPAAAPTPTPAAYRGGRVTVKHESPGSIFVDSPQFQQMMAPYPDGEIPSGVRPQMPGAVRVGSFENA